MDKRTGLLSITLALLVSVLVSQTAGLCSDEPTIWFDPKHDVPDYFDLFAPSAKWTRAAKYVKGFEVSVQVVSKGSDADLTEMFTWLRQHNIALCLGMLPLTPSEQGCGHHVEGYSAFGQCRKDAKRVQSLQGEPQFYDMDEPLFYGHYYDGPNACHSSIEEIAADVAEKVRQVRSVFPNVQIGESEPIHPPVSLDDLEKWFDAFKKATGTPLAFLSVDLQWSHDWQGRLVEVAHLCARKGIRLHVIYNGSGRDSSDEEWVLRAFANARAVESLIKPDVVSIASWNRFPTHVLPESDPNTLTGLVDRYLAWKRSRN